MFVHQPYAELRRLGLTETTERAVREAFPDQTGMLVVKSVIPGSAAAGFFEPGDILVQVGDQLITEFVPLAAVMDDSVGKPLMFEIQRGGATLRRDLAVDDLHSITPAEFVQFGDAVVHDLSYQQARHFNRSLSGVYVANPGYVLGTAAIPRGSVITALDGKVMEDLDDLETALAGIADGQRASVRFISFDDPQNEKLRIITIDRSWFPSQRCQRDDPSGYWPCRELAAGAGEFRYALYRVWRFRKALPRYGCDRRRGTRLGSR
jgi:S1-C subfamily serine protease